MAAQALVVKSHEMPHETYTTNVLGTLNILEIARTKKFIKLETFLSYKS